MRNSILLMITTLMNAALGYGFWGVAAHTLDAKSVGLATAILGAAQLVALVGTFGMGSWFVASIGRMNNTEWAQAVTRCVMISLISMTVLGSIALLALPQVSEQYVSLGTPLGALAFLAACLAMGSSALTDDAMVAEEAGGYVFGRNFIFGGGKLILLILAVVLFGTKTEASVLGSWTIAGLVALLVSGLRWIPKLRPGVRPTIKGGVRTRTLIRMSSQHQAIDIGGKLPLFLLPTVAVARIGAEDAATLSLTWMVATVFFIISPAVSSALTARGGRDGLGDSVKKSAKFIGLLLALTLPVITLVPGLILNLFGGSVAANGSRLLVVLAISAVPDAVTNVWIAKRRVERKLFAPILVNVAMASITLVGSWFMLPKYGIIAAGYAWLISQTVGAITVFIEYLVTRGKPSNGSSASGTPTTSSTSFSKEVAA